MDWLPNIFRRRQLYDDLSEIDSDTKLDSARDRQFCIAYSQLLLGLEGTLHGLHGARKLSEQAISSRSDRAAAMALN